MTHEIKILFGTLRQWQEADKRALFVSVVALDGTSYRRPGVRMVINEEGITAGAVSGGCVEDEIIRQAQSVFDRGRAKMMTYDGRLRIGCEGILYILIEPVLLSVALLEEVEKQMKGRKTFHLDSFYFREVGEDDRMGSVIRMGDTKYTLHPSFHPDKA